MLYGIPLSFSSAKAIWHFVVVVVAVIENNGCYVLFATNFSSLVFCLSVHAFWQSHKMELRLVKRSVAITMYSSETSFRVMVQICFIHFFSSFHFSASSTVMQKSLCILGARTVFFWPFKMYFAWSNISCNTCFSIAGKLQECFAKQYIYSHICVCERVLYASICQENLFNFIQLFFPSSVPICWSGEVEFFGTFFMAF